MLAVDDCIFIRANCVDIFTYSFFFYILSMRVPSYSVHFQLLDGNTLLNEKEKAVITLLWDINLFFLLFYRLKIADFYFL